jgi:hypothetical protein
MLLIARMIEQSLVSDRRTEVLQVLGSAEKSCKSKGECSIMKFFSLSVFSGLFVTMAHPAIAANSSAELIQLISQTTDIGAFVILFFVVAFAVATGFRMRLLSTGLVKFNILSVIAPFLVALMGLMLLDGFKFWLSVDLALSAFFGIGALLASLSIKKMQSEDLL